MQVQIKDRCVRDTSASVKRLLSTFTIMVLHRYWLHLSTIVLGLVSPSWASFENTGVTRSVDLGGSLVYTTTTFNVKALEDGSNVYVFALTEKEQERTSWMEARFKGHSAPLSLENHGLSQEYVLDSTLVVCMWLRLSLTARRTIIPSLCQKLSIKTRPRV